MINLQQRIVNASGQLTPEGALMIQTLAAAAFPVAVAADIASITSTINTRQKRAYLPVFDATNARLMIATGPNAGDPWAVADGSATVTPA